MPMFSYKARGSHGDAIGGTIEANGTDAAATRLIESGLTPIDIRPYVERESLGGRFDIVFGPRVTNEDLIQFCRQMHSLLRAGVPIFRAVAGLATSSGNAKLKSALREVMDALESGRTLADGLERHPTVFSAFFVSLVRVGETAGRLQDIFAQLAFYLDRDHATRAKVTSALRYPCIVLAAIAVALLVMTVWVIPAFSNLFSSFGSELPLSTRVLLFVSEFVTAHWAALLGGFVLMVYGIGRYVRTDGGRYRWDKLKLGLPLVGSVVHKASLARFSRLFSLSVDSGVPLTTALSVVGSALNNRFLEERLLGMRDGVEQGKSLSLTATNSGVFDPLVLQMLSVGEESGTVVELLSEIADYYDREVSYAADRLGAAIEPILTVVVGGMLTVLAMGIFVPMWDLASVALR